MALLTPETTRWVATATALVFVLASVSFVVPASGPVSPVVFDDTVKTGGTSVDVHTAEVEGFEVPLAQVRSSRYRYVIGYYDVRTTAADVSTPKGARQFGDPFAMFVTDYATVSPDLDGDGYLRTERNRNPGWTKAPEASFVVDSGARIPSGPIAVPFSDATVTRSFADAHGGEVVDWATFHDRAGDPLSSRPAAFEPSVAAHHEWADGTTAADGALFDRPVSTVVGEDAPTVEAAVTATPTNTIVYVPAGTYSVDAAGLNRSVTLRGAGRDTRLAGDDNGSVVHLRTDWSAAGNLAIAGTGGVGMRRVYATNESVDWDMRAELAYGRGDAGVVLNGANESAVRGVEIDTPASGIITRESADSVVDGVTVRGADEPSDGFMGVVLIGERAVVQDSVFIDGRGGVYTHRADGNVVRDNRVEDGRYGVHQMYTSGALVVDNVVRGDRVGVVLMTRPVGNLVVGDDVHESDLGFMPAGSDTYVADDVFAGNDYDMDVNGDRQAYVGDVVADNGVGVRGSSTLPTDVVVRNDIVDNDVRVELSLGPMRTWTAGGEGNYRGDLPLEDADADGIYGRTHQPSGPVDAELDREPDAFALSESPAMRTLRRARDAMSGPRGSGVVDAVPRTEPVRPGTLAALNATGGTDD